MLGEAEPDTCSRFTGACINFITASIFIIRQYSYHREADLGFNREDVLYIRTKGRVWDKYPVIKQELWKLFQYFSYSTELRIGVFLSIFVLSILLALATVLFHALRIARANPVNSLRYE